MICRSLLKSLCAILVGVGAFSCSHIDDTRIPPTNVNVVFTTVGMWNTYGVSGALDHRRFIHDTRNPVPPDFPFTGTTYTGYGGILLVGDLYGNPLAYDLACPYEVNPQIRVVVNEDTHDAACPVCGSTYDVFGGDGRPTSGPSAEKGRGYGLRRYKVIDGGAMNYKVITR